MSLTSAGSISLDSTFKKGFYGEIKALLSMLLYEHRNLRLDYKKSCFLRPLYVHSAGVMCLWYVDYWIVGFCDGPANSALG
jgi:hypothetical protein